jgi:hypothetical protein
MIAHAPPPRSDWVALPHPAPTLADDAETIADTVRKYIWIAILVLVLTAIMRTRLGIEAKLYQLPLGDQCSVSRAPTIRALQRIDPQTTYRHRPNV